MTGPPRSGHKVSPAACAWLTVFILLLFDVAAFLDRQGLSLMSGPLERLNRPGFVGGSNS